MFSLEALRFIAEALLGNTLWGTLERWNMQRPGIRKRFGRSATHHGDAPVWGRGTHANTQPRKSGELLSDSLVQQAEKTNARGSGHISAWRRRAAVVLLSLTLAMGISVGAAAPSQAATASCSNGACVVKLNWTETNLLSRGRVPKVKTYHPALTASYYALAYGHVLFRR